MRIHSSIQTRFVLQIYALIHNPITGLYILQATHTSSKIANTAPLSLALALARSLSLSLPTMFALHDY